MIWFKKDNLIFLFFITFSILLFYSLQISSEHITQWLFTDHIKFLDVVTGGRQLRPLEYYLGEAENDLWGPLKSLLSGGIFFTLALRYLRFATPWQFGLACFIYILASRPEVLFNPPYAEAINGPFTDAVWLLQNNLNWFSLLKQENSFAGGPQTYPLSIFPLILAVLIKIAPSMGFFIVLFHLLVFMMAAAVVSLLRKICLRFFSETISLCAAILLLSLPLFQSMMELINMEMSYLFCTMLSAHFLMKKRFAPASILAILSMLIKIPGIIACMTIVFLGIVLFFLERQNKGRWKILAWAGIVSLVAAGEVIGRNIINNRVAPYTKVYFGAGWENVVHLPTFWIYLASLVILIVQIIQQQRREGTLRFSSLIQQYWDICIMFLLAGLWFWVHFNFEDLAARYMLLLTPFFIFCFIYLIYHLIPAKHSILPILGIMIIGSLMCSHGLIYGDRLTDPTNMERSLEYRNYLHLQKMIVQEMKENYSDYTIGAPIIIAQILGIPEMGHVKEPLKDVMIYGFDANLKGYRTYPGIEKLNVLRTVYIGFEKDRVIEEVPYPVDPNDIIKKKLIRGNLEAIVFMGGFGIEKMRRLAIIYHQQQLKNNH